VGAIENNRVFEALLESMVAWTSDPAQSNLARVWSCTSKKANHASPGVLDPSSDASVQNGIKTRESDSLDSDRRVVQKIAMSTCKRFRCKEFEIVLWYQKIIKITIHIFSAMNT
jgi:hypothetical protein